MFPSPRHRGLFAHPFFRKAQIAIPKTMLGGIKDLESAKNDLYCSVLTIPFKKKRKENPLLISSSTSLRTVCPVHGHVHGHGELAPGGEVALDLPGVTPGWKMVLPTSDGCSPRV